MADDFGTDISWNQSTDTLGTVTGKDNMTQSIINRLNTTYTELNWVYPSYGCNYRDYLGMKADNTSLEFIKNSLKQALDEEERITEYDLNVEYAGDGKVWVDLCVDGTSMEFELE